MRCYAARSLSAVRNLPAYSFSYSTAARAGADNSTLTNAISPLSSLAAALWEITDSAAGVGVAVGSGVEVGAGVFVGIAVGSGVGTGVDVGSGVFVGIAVGFGVGVAADGAGAEASGSEVEESEQANDSAASAAANDSASVRPNPERLIRASATFIVKRCSLLFPDEGGAVFCAFRHWKILPKTRGGRQDGRRSPH